MSEITDELARINIRRREDGPVSQLRQRRVTFHFCPVCGSTVYYVLDAFSDFVGVKVGAFADPTFPPPMGSGFEEYKHPWAMNVAALPMPLGHHK